MPGVASLSDAVDVAAAVLSGVLDDTALTVVRDGGGGGRCGDGAVRAHAGGGAVRSGGTSAGGGGGSGGVRAGEGGTGVYGGVLSGLGDGAAALCCGARCPRAVGAGAGAETSGEHGEVERAGLCECLSRGCLYGVGAGGERSDDTRVSAGAAVVVGGDGGAEVAAVCGVVGAEFEQGVNRGGEVNGDLFCAAEGESVVLGTAVADEGAVAGTDPGVVSFCRGACCQGAQVSRAVGAGGERTADHGC